MNFIPRISSSMSELWTSWIMAGLLLLLLFADFYMRGIVRGSFRSLFVSKDRDSIFSEVTHNFYGQAALLLYKAGVLGMMIHFLVFRGGEYSCLDWVYISLLVLGIGVVKYIIALALSFVFINKSMFETAYLRYSDLITVTTILLYPVLLVVLFTPFISFNVAVIILSIIGSFTLVVWIWRAFQLFFTNLLASFYIFLYLCTLELLPFVGLLFAAFYIVN